MKIFGLSLMMWALIVLALFIGTRKPDLFGSLPVLGK